MSFFTFTAVVWINHGVFVPVGEEIRNAVHFLSDFYIGCNNQYTFIEYACPEIYKNTNK